MHPEDHQNNREPIESLFNKKTGLSGDSINAFVLLGNLDQDLNESTRRIYFNSAVAHPIPEYLDYLREQNPLIAEALFAKSAPDKVSEFDALVKRFNDDRDRIRTESDYQAVIEVWRAARKLVLDK